MNILQAANEVFLLRFFPDGRRLIIVGLVSPEKKATLEIWPIPDGERLALPLELNLETWWYEALYGNAIAIHPDGETCWLAWGGNLFAFRTADVKLLKVPSGIAAHQVFLSAKGDCLLTAKRMYEHKQLFAVALDAKGGKVLWKKDMPANFCHLAGFLPDGERFITVDSVVRIRTFADDEVLAEARYPANSVHQPQISPDGRYLGVIGYSCMYIYDLANLGKPRRIGGTRSCGDFVSFAFDPDGRTLAVIHGGPTLVKVYDLDTLRLAHTYKWKLGPLGCVAFSPDGTLGAAGSRDGRIVIWDVDR